MLRLDCDALGWEYDIGRFGLLILMLVRQYGVHNKNEKINPISRGDKIVQLAAAIFSILSLVFLIVYSIRLGVLQKIESPGLITCVSLAILFCAFCLIWVPYVLVKKLRSHLKEQKITKLENLDNVKTV